MRVVIDDDGERIETEERDLDGESIEVGRCNGFGGCDVQVSGGIMTWRQLDELKQAIALAETKWRLPTGGSRDD